MGAQLRIYKQKIRSAKQMKKITRAMELIAAARIRRAQARAQAAAPYDEAIAKAVRAVSAHAGDVKHVLLEERPNVRRAAVLVLSSDRGLAGPYNTNVFRETTRLRNRLLGAGVETDFYLVGLKAEQFFGFRQNSYVRSWTGDAETPGANLAHEVGEVLLKSYELGGDEGGVDEIYIVYNHFINLVRQEPRVTRFLPLHVVEADENEREVFPLYEFEPTPNEVFDALLPQFVESRIFTALLQSAASKQASTQKAMHAASDNADKLIREYSLEMNKARQAEVTQQLSEIVGGADALANS